MTDRLHTIAHPLVKAGAQMIPQMLLSPEKGDLADVAPPVTSWEFPLSLLLQPIQFDRCGKGGQGRVIFG